MQRSDREEREENTRTERREKKENKREEEEQLKRKRKREKRRERYFHSYAAASLWLLCRFNAFRFVGSFLFFLLSPFGSCFDDQEAEIDCPMKGEGFFSETTINSRPQNSARLAAMLASVCEAAARTLKCAPKME